MALSRPGLLPVAARRKSPTSEVAGSLAFQEPLTLQIIGGQRAMVDRELLLRRRTGRALRMVTGGDI